MEQLNPANSKYSTTEQAEDLVTFNMRIKIALQPQSKLSTTLSKDHPNKSFKSIPIVEKILELPQMSLNSQICSFPIYQKTLLTIN